MSGEVAQTEVEARIQVASIFARIEDVLDEYIQRASAQQVEARPDLEAQFGLEEGTLGDNVDLDLSIRSSAIVELLADVLHYCSAHEISYGECAQIATRVYANQYNMAHRLIVYGRQP